MSLPIKFSLRFIVVCVLMLLLLHQYGEVLVKPLLPLYEWEIVKIADDYRILSFGIDNESLDRVIRLKVTLAKPIYVAGQSLMPDPRGIAEASTTIGHIWQMVVVCIAMILAWPAQHLRKYFIRVAIVIPLLVLFTMLDSPLALLASLWDLILQNMSPDSFSPLISWNSFLERGGRFALGLVAGLIAIWLAEQTKKSA
jgi:hypothetical protein